MQFEATDQGTGITDLDLAMRDGVSEGQDLTAQDNIRKRNGLGYGLGAIRRLMDRMEIVTSGAGTILRAEKDLLPGRS